MRKAILGVIDFVAKLFIILGVFVIAGTVGAEENNMLTNSEFVYQMVVGFGIAITAAVVMIIANKVDENYADT